MTSNHCHRAALQSAVALILAALLIACSSEQAPDPGMLQAPDFADESGRLERAWRFLHHASTDSYRLTVANGIARIERIGAEPWSNLVQQVESALVSELAGRHAIFSIDLRARLDDSEYGRPLEPTGLFVRTWTQPTGRQSALSTMLGAPRSSSERLALDADVQIPEWTRHSIEFLVPAEATRIDVGAVMSTGGALELRHPALRVAAD